jgi:formylglycine-generating enzyme required for sulfatase activity
VVNRGTADAAGPQIEIASSDTRRFYDCYHGVPLSASASPQGPSSRRLAFAVEAGGFGCVLATPNKTLSADTVALLAAMKRLTSGAALNGLSRAWTALQQKMVPIPRTKPHALAPEGMVAIPAVANYTFVATGVEIEGQKETPFAPPNAYGSSGATGVDVQFPWEKVATPHHKHIMAISKFYMDRTPVTRAQYAGYLEASKYVPRDAHNFLRNWTKVGDSWQFHPADAEKPVVHVSLTEARLYCAHFSKRLPHTWEWSYAAQGTDGRVYPWGPAGGCNATDVKCQERSAIDGSHCPRLQQHTQGDQAALAQGESVIECPSPLSAHRHIRL